MTTTRYDRSILKTITYVICQGPGVRKNRGATEGVRKSKRLVDNRRFWGDVEQEGDEVLVPLEDPSQEEEVDDVEEYVPEPSKEEYAETPTTAVNVAKEENLKRNLEPFYIMMVKLSTGLLGGFFRNIASKIFYISAIL